MITLRCEQVTQRKIKISVVDTGVGIKRKHLGNLGYVSTYRPIPKKEKLLGMGLSVSNLISSFISPKDQVGIFVSSQKGTGSIFSFYLLDHSPMEEPTFAGSRFEDDSHYIEKSLSNQSPEEDYNYTESSCRVPCENLDFFPINNTYSFIDDLDKKAISNPNLNITTLQSEISKTRRLNRNRFEKKNYTQYTGTMVQRNSAPKKKFTIMTNVHPDDNSIFENTNLNSLKSMDQITISSNSSISKEIRNNLRPFLVGSKENQNLSGSQTTLIGKSNQNLGPLYSEDLSSFRHEKAKIDDLINISLSKPCSCPDVLIVDDNGYNIHVLRLMIEKFKLKVRKLKLLRIDICKRLLFVKLSMINY
jgi:hypothetical protein